MNTLKPKSNFVFCVVHCRRFSILQLSRVYFQLDAVHTAPGTHTRREADEIRRQQATSCPIDQNAHDRSPRLAVTKRTQRHSPLHPLVTFPKHASSTSANERQQIYHIVVDSRCNHGHRESRDGRQRDHLPRVRSTPPYVILAGFIGRKNTTHKTRKRRD